MPGPRVCRQCPSVQHCLAAGRRYAQCSRRCCSYGWLNFRFIYQEFQLFWIFLTFLTIFHKFAEISHFWKFPELRFEILDLNRNFQSSLNFLFRTACPWRTCCSRTGSQPSAQWAWVRAQMLWSLPVRQIQVGWTVSRMTDMTDLALTEKWLIKLTLCVTWYLQTVCTCTFCWKKLGIEHYFLTDWLVDIFTDWLIYWVTDILGAGWLTTAGLPAAMIQANGANQLNQIAVLQQQQQAQVTEWLIGWFCWQIFYTQYPLLLMVVLWLTDFCSVTVTVLSD